jgi:anterior pharynx defective protein 1
VTDGSTRLVDNKHILAYVAGLGFGIMSGAFSIINLLAEAVGPGTIGLRQGNDHPNFLLTSAFITLCIILLNTAWGVILFQALDHRNWALIAYVGVAHLAASGFTLYNVKNIYFMTITLDYIILALSAWIAFYVAGGKWNFKKRPGGSPVRANGQGQSVLAEEEPVTEVQG